MSHVKRTTIRGLKHETTTVLSWVAQGETVEIRRRDEPVALLQPAKRRTAIRRPDFAARLRRVYGSRILGTTATELIAKDRGER